MGTAGFWKTCGRKRLGAQNEEVRYHQPRGFFQVEEGLEKVGFQKEHGARQGKVPKRNLKEKT